MVMGGLPRHTQLIKGGRADGLKKNMMLITGVTEPRRLTITWATFNLGKENKT